MRNERVLIADVTRAVSMTAESDALAVATVANWMNVQSWNLAKYDNHPMQPAKRAGVPAFDLKVFCDANEDLTSAKLYGIQAETQILADDNVDTVDHANDELDLASHAYLTGDGPVRLTTSDTLPAGLEVDTDYYIRVVTSGTISLHLTRAEAVAGTGKVAFSDVGTGTHTVVDVQDDDVNPDNRTKRLHWYLYGALNLGNTINVDVQEGYVERLAHNPLTLYYAVVASSGVGAQTVTFVLVPMIEQEQ